MSKHLRLDKRSYSGKYTCTYSLKHKLNTQTHLSGVLPPFPAMVMLSWPRTQSQWHKISQLALSKVIILLIMPSISDSCVCYTLSKSDTMDALYVIESILGIWRADEIHLAKAKMKIILFVVATMLQIHKSC